jgi:adenylate cyclase
VVQPKKSPATGRLRWLALLPIPLLWCLAAHFGWLTFLENRLLDWRFRFRGEIDAPVKVLYVDVDSQSIAEIGGFPWSRAYFARAASALIDQGHVKAIGLDFVLSEKGIAQEVDRKMRRLGNGELALLLRRDPPPPFVLAAAYSAAEDRDINGQLIRRELPLLSKHPDLARVQPPEVPSLRLVASDDKKLYTPPVVGLIDTLDGATRTVPAFVPLSYRSYLHMSVQLARLHFGVAEDGVKIGSNAIDLVRPDGSRVARIPLRDGQLVDINWFSGWNSPKNPRIGFSTVFGYAEMLKSEKPEEKKAAEEFFAQPGFKDAVVLIGPVDPLMQDLATTPFDDVPVPKVGVHGNLVKTIVAGEYLHGLPVWRGIRWLDYLLTFLLTGAVSALAMTGGKRSAWHKAAGVLLLLWYGGAAFLVFKATHLVVLLGAPLGAAFTTSFVGLIWQLVDEEKQKGRIKGMFGTYLAPAVVNAMVESGKDPELGGHDAEITAYFSDIQSFSSFSEVLSSARLTELLNEYLTACTDIVQAEGGSLDKYIGDAVVAMYGAPIEVPDHAHRACVASLRVQRRIAELREKWRTEGDKWPALVHRLRTRIGLNTGVCMIGNMGSRTRFNYTMMGDNVNLAARMESGAKSWGVYTMCTEATKLACQSRGDDVVFRSLGRIVVKGRTQAVPIHEIVGLKGEVPDATRECIDLSEKALQRYYARDWAGARALFERGRTLEPNQPAPDNGISLNPSRVYLQILEHFAHEPPPADWDGTYVMKEK